MTRPELSAFESGAVAPECFDHLAHLRIAFSMLEETAFLDAAKRYSAGVATLAARAGKPEKFNLTITLAFLAIIAERMAASPDSDWPDFIAANRDLLDRSLLTRWYTPERLTSPMARTQFLLPEPGIGVR